MAARARAAVSPRTKRQSGGAIPARSTTALRAASRARHAADWCAWLAEESRASRAFPARRHRAMRMNARRAGRERYRSASQTWTALSERREFQGEERASSSRLRQRVAKAQLDEFARVTRSNIR